MADREKLRLRLEIVPDDLDDCLVEQPIYFHDVADAYAEAMARRDEAKLELKDTIAEMDQALRKKYYAEELKVTETALEKQLRTLPKLQTLERAVLDLTAEAEKWLALKEAFHQRSYMLGHLVGKHISELNSLGLERSAKGSRSNLADARYEELSRDRAKRREERTTTKFKPRV